MNAKVGGRAAGVDGATNISFNREYMTLLTGVWLVSSVEGLVVDNALCGGALLCLLGTIAGGQRKR